jgi:hypothetical protein
VPIALDQTVHTRSTSADPATVTRCRRWRPGLADGTPVIISGGLDGTMRVWRLADGTRSGSIVAAAVWADIAMHEIALQVRIRQMLSYFGTKRTVETIG